MKRSTRGFTLIEVLIVIAIIGLLAGILLPVYGAVLERGRQSTCMSNLHQIGIAVQLYRDDYGGRDPVQGQAMTWDQLGVPAFGGTSLDQLRDEYLKNKGVMQCPDYHGETPAQDMSTTYQFTPSPDLYFVPPAQRFSQSVARRGMEVPLVTDEQHNALVGVPMEEQPRWVLKRILVLRLNGQVQSKMVPCRTWYMNF